jgi:hypothetical protein
MSGRLQEAGVRHRRGAGHSKVPYEMAAPARERGRGIIDVNSLHPTQVDTAMIPNRSTNALPIPAGFSIK